MSWGNQHINEQLQHNQNLLLSSQAAQETVHVGFLLVSRNWRTALRWVIRLHFILTEGLVLPPKEGVSVWQPCPSACEDRRVPSTTTSSHPDLVKHPTRKKEVSGAISGGASGGDKRVKFITQCLLVRCPGLPSPRAHVLTMLYIFCLPSYLHPKAVGNI